MVFRWIVLIAGIAMACALNASEKKETLSRKEQLHRLQQMQILVPSWGWSVEEMAAEAQKRGYQVINGYVSGANEGTRTNIELLKKYDLKCLARVKHPTQDPFDPEEVKRGCEELNKKIRFFETKPIILGVVIGWGLYSEGGFPFDYRFSEKARQAFNVAMKTPNVPLPRPPARGKPGSLRWVQWQEFRSRTLREFRAHYVASAKKYTTKLVGTWSEVYPTNHYNLNMGDAPGADFMFYDLSFGDVTCNQRIAFGECCGKMPSCRTYEIWLERELPLAAKAVGEGVVPIGFQYPMRRGARGGQGAGAEKFKVDRIEQVYALRFGPEIRKLLDAVKKPLPEPEVALVYQSFAASGLPGNGGPRVLSSYDNISARQVEGLLRMMGVRLQVIPYEWLETHDLSAFKAVIIPDPVYITAAMNENLQKARRVLFCGEFMIAHRDSKTEKGSYLGTRGFSTQMRSQGIHLRYNRTKPAPLAVSESSHPWCNNILPEKGIRYPQDQIVEFEKYNVPLKTLITCGDKPFLAVTSDARQAFLTTRFFYHAWHNGAIARMCTTFLRNYLTDAGAEIRIKTYPLYNASADGIHGYGPYGIGGNIAWNITKRPVKLELTDGRKIVIPASGWTSVSGKSGR